MDKISVKCESCGADFQVPASLAGQRGKCSCGKLIEVPTLQELANTDTVALSRAEEGQGAEKHAAGEPTSDLATAAVSTSSKEGAEEQAGEAPADEWYFMKNGVQQGPISSRGIRMLLNSGDLKPNDQIWSPSMPSWLAVSKVEQFQEDLEEGEQKEEQKPEPEQQKAETAEAEEKEEDMWYFSAGGVAQGPVTYGQIGQMIQSGQLAANDMVFSPALGAWQALGEVPQFQSLVPEVSEEEAADEQWYLASGGQTYGPYPTSALQQMVRDGQVPTDTLAFSQRLGSWQSIGDIAELNAGPQAQEPAEPSPAGEPSADIEGAEAEMQMQPQSEAEAAEAEAPGPAEPEPADVAETEPKPEAKPEAAPAEPQEQWYAIRSGEQIGPYSKKEMRLIVKRGGLSAEDVVWSQALGEWKPVAQVPGLASVLPKRASIEDQAHPWYFTAGGQTAGPLGLEELVGLISSGHVGPEDMVFSKQIGSWQPVQQVEKLQPALHQAREGAGTEAQWYFMEHGERKGPVSPALLQEMSEKGDLQPTVHVWRPGMAQWVQMRDVPELMPEGAEPQEPSAAERSAPTVTVEREPEPAAAPDRAPRGAPAAAPEEKKGKGMVIAAVVGVLLLIAALGAGLFLLTRPPEGDGGEGPPTPPPTTGKTEPEVPTPPPTLNEKEIVMDFIKGFLSGNKEKRKAALKAHAPGGWLDVYSDDSESRATFLLQHSEPEISEVDCNIMRAFQPDTFFVYHVKSDDTRLDIEYYSQHGELREQRLLGKDFRPVRCFIVKWPGEHVFSELRVLGIGEGAAFKIVALGRVGYVGTTASDRQVVYISGYMQEKMYETASNLIVRAERAPRNMPSQWRDYGIAMTADPKVMPPEVKRTYSNSLSERKEFANDYILLNIGPELSKEELQRKYGEAQRVERAKPFDGDFLIRSVGEGLGMMNNTMEIHYYGPLGIAFRPGESEPIGLVMSLPKSKVPD